jgi:SOS response regulatory protein OraA/RecX
LRRRHIDQVHIDSALEQIDDDDEQSRATELAVKRAGQLSSYDLETAKRRLHGFLSRKGYNSSVVRAAIDEALSSRSVSSGSKSSSSKSSSSVSSSSKPSSSKSSSSGVRFR